MSALPSYLLSGIFWEQVHVWKYGRHNTLKNLPRRRINSDHISDKSLGLTFTCSFPNKIKQSLIVSHFTHTSTCTTTADNLNNKKINLRSKSESSSSSSSPLDSVCIGSPSNITPFPVLPPVLAPSWLLVSRKRVKYCTAKSTRSDGLCRSTSTV